MFRNNKPLVSQRYFVSQQTLKRSQLWWGQYSENVRTVSLNVLTPASNHPSSPRVQCSIPSEQWSRGKQRDLVPCAKTMSQNLFLFTLSHSISAGACGITLIPRKFVNKFWKSTNTFLPYKVDQIRPHPEVRDNPRSLTIVHISWRHCWNTWRGSDHWESLVLICFEKQNTRVPCRADRPSGRLSHLNSCRHAINAQSGDWNQIEPD